MIRIILTEEQAQLLTNSSEPVLLVDGEGKALRLINPVWVERNLVKPDWRPEDLEEARRRLDSGEPSLTTPQLLKLLRDKYPA